MNEPIISTQHWTHNLVDFTYWVSSDFTAQIETRLEEKGISKNALAERVNVSPSRVSQILNDPGNLTVGNVVKYARAVGMKVALVVYDDLDSDNVRGPISADVFTKCWERMERPTDFFDLEQMRNVGGCWVLSKTFSATNDHNNRIQGVKVEKDTAAAVTYGAYVGEWRQGA
jgi:transcriptional regulator with XRE-family HTH domain